MWQRVQTLYLAIATGLIASLFWCDVAEVVLPGDRIDSIPYTGKLLYEVLLIIITVAQVLALGGFKWRMKQMRVAVFTVVLCLGFQGVLVYDYILNHNEIVFSFTAVFPFAAALLDIMAIRNILIDEALVKSASRLRLPRNKKK